MFNWERQPEACSGPGQQAGGARAFSEPEPSLIGCPALGCPLQGGEGGGASTVVPGDCPHGRSHLQGFSPPPREPWGFPPMRFSCCSASCGPTGGGGKESLVLVLGVSPHVGSLPQPQDEGLLPTSHQEDRPSTGKAVGSWADWGFGAGLGLGAGAPFPFPHCPPGWQVQGGCRLGSRGFAASAL